MPQQFEEQRDCIIMVSGIMQKANEFEVKEINNKNQVISHSQEYSKISAKIFSQFCLNPLLYLCMHTI